MFEELIVDQNPHWDGTLYEEGVCREVLIKVKDYLVLPHIIALVGVRRAGKSTIARQAINFLIREQKVAPRNILFLNLENPQFSRYRSDVAYLEQVYNDYLKIINPKGRVYCFFDEVHFFEDWQVFIKAGYEKKDIKFIVTGSNSHLLSAELITLLSGRTLPLEIYPFSFSEYVSAKGVVLEDAVSVTRQRNHLRKLFDDYLRQGGFPELSYIERTDIQKEILAMYARNILYQDIAPRFAVKKAVTLESLFFYLASNIASLYSFNKLAGLVGLNDKTVKDYLGYFNDAYLLFSLDSFSFSAREQIKSPKKIYAIDTGMVVASGCSFSKNQGHLLENLVYLELKRHGEELFYYKTANNLEVDFACTRKGKVTRLIQVAYELDNNQTRNREIRALARALTETGLKTGDIITYEQEDKLTTGGREINLIPAHRFFLNDHYR